MSRDIRLPQSTRHTSERAQLLQPDSRACGLHPGLHGSLAPAPSLCWCGSFGEVLSFIPTAFIVPGIAGAR